MRSKPKAARLADDGENALKLLAKEIGDSVGFAKAAEILNVDLSTIHRWRTNGTLPAWRLGGRWRVSVAAIKAMIERGSTGSSSTPGRPGTRGASFRKTADEQATTEVASRLR